MMGSTLHAGAVVTGDAGFLFKAAEHGHARHGDGKVNEAGGDVERQMLIGARGHEMGAGHDFRRAQGKAHGRVLEQDGIFVGPSGNGQSESLGKNDVPYGLKVGHAERPARLELTCRKGHDGPAEYLRLVGRARHAEHDARGADGAHIQPDEAEQAVIEEKKQEDEAEKVLCPQCHAKNKKGSKFCEECGQTLEEKDPTEEVKEQPEKVPEKESTIGLCPSCGFKNKENAKFCKKCGTKLKVENSQEDQAEKQEDKSQKVEEAKQEVLKEEKNDKSTKNELKEQKLAAKREKNKKKSLEKRKKSKKKLIIIICILLIVFIAIGTMFHFGLFDNIVSKKENATKEEVEEKTKDGWSSWSQELPKNVTEENYQIEQKTQYSKRTKKTKTSTSKTLEGWTLYDTKESGEEKTKEVETAKKIKEFEANKKIKIINKETITEKYEAVLCGYYNPKDGQNRFYTPNDKKPYCDEEDSYTLKEDKGEYPAGTYKVGDDFNKSYTNSNGEKIFYKVVKINPYKIKYTYKDSDDKTTYYFYKWSSWSKYQDEEITEDDTTEVKTRTVYRYKEKESN